MGTLQLKILFAVLPACCLCVSRICRAGARKGPARGCPWRAGPPMASKQAAARTHAGICHLMQHSCERASCIRPMGESHEHP
ncbi:hypothetical protein EI94DRAFT_431997 [Lactarius quietus]|nr:hypothetical protein EI94DRAFT_431997 [Lactarius quietus]